MVYSETACTADSSWACKADPYVGGPADDAYDVVGGVGKPEVGQAAAGVVRVVVLAVELAVAFQQLVLKYQFDRRLVSWQQVSEPQSE